VFTGKPLVFKAGSAQILGEFDLRDNRVPAVRKLDSAFRHPDCSLCGNLAHAISATGRDLA
jgi:hypothetical protein